MHLLGGHEHSDHTDHAQDDSAKKQSNRLATDHFSHLVKSRIVLAH